MTKMIDCSRVNAHPTQNKYLRHLEFLSTMNMHLHWLTVFLVLMGK